MDCVKGRFAFPFGVEYAIICAVSLYIIAGNMGIGGDDDSKGVRRSESARRNAAQRTQTMRRAGRTKFSVDCNKSTSGLFVGVLTAIAVVVAATVNNILLDVPFKCDDREHVGVSVYQGTELGLLAVALACLAVGAFQLRGLHLRHAQHAGSSSVDLILLAVTLAGVLSYDSFYVLETVRPPLPTRSSASYSYS